MGYEMVKSERNRFPCAVTTCHYNRPSSDLQRTAVNYKYSGNTGTAITQLHSVSSSGQPRNVETNNSYDIEKATDLRHRRHPSTWTECSADLGSRVAPYDSRSSESTSDSAVTLLLA